MVKAIVFVHGWASSPRVWEQQVRYFSRPYEVILPDLTAATDIREAAKTVVDSVKDENGYVLAGWSLGWLVVLESLKSLGLKPSGIVSVNSTARFIDDGYLGAGLTKTHLAKMIRDCKRDPEKALEDFGAAAFSDVRRETLAGVGLCAADCVINSASSVPNTCGNLDRYSLVGGLEMLRVCDYRDYLGQIDVPTLLIAGALDPICPKEAAVYMHQRIRGSELQIMDCRHAPFLARPGEFNAIVDSFVKGLR